MVADRSTTSFGNRGCLTCRERRIKCDRSQPSCQRCIKSRRECRRPDPSLTIHSENQYASGRTKRPKGPRSSYQDGQKDEEPAVSPPRTTQTIVQLQGQRKPPLIAPPRLFSRKSQAVCFYVNFQITRSGNDWPSLISGMDTSIPAILAARWEDSPVVRLALSAVALAVFARTQRYTQAAIDACRNYQQLLGIVRDSIAGRNSIVTRQDDVEEYLFAMYSMARYEDAMYRQSGIAPARIGSPHHDGAMALLEKWAKNCPPQDGPMAHCRNGETIKHSRRSVIKSALMRSRFLPLSLHDGVNFGERGIDLDFDRILVKLVDLRARLSSISEEIQVDWRSGEYRAVGEEAQLSLETIASEAQSLEYSLQALKIRVSKGWHRTILMLASPSCFAMDIWTTYVAYIQEHVNASQPFLYLYSSPGHAAVWNQYSATRMLICDTQRKALGLIPPDTYNEETRRATLEQCRATMNQMAADIASSLPCCLDPEHFEQLALHFSDSMDQTITSPVSKDTEQIAATSETPQQHPMQIPGRAPAPHLAAWAIWPLTIASSMDSGLDATYRRFFQAEMARLGGILGIGALEAVDGGWFRV